MGIIEELSQEQLHYDISELTEAIHAYMALQSGQPLQKDGKTRRVEVVIANPAKEFDGQVEVNNEVSAKLTNIAEIADRLDAIRRSIADNKTESVTIKDPVVIKDLAKLENLLTKLLEKETSISVEAPQVKLNSPDSVKINNWPTGPDNPISVRLTDGKRFLTELVKVIGGGGGSAIPDGLIAGGALKVVNPDGTFISAGSGAGGGTYTLANANDTFGSLASVADGSTVDIISIPSSTAGFKVAGMSCTGNGDGYFYVTIAGTKVLSARTSASQPSVFIPLPNPVSMSLGTAVSLKVTNVSGSTADYEGTLLGA